MENEPGLNIINPEAFSDMAIPVPEDSVKAGFPSPAENYSTEAIDLNVELIRHREATFYARVSGNSMEGCGISDGDLVIIDKSLEARAGDYVAAYVNGEFTIKQYMPDPDRGVAWLLPANDSYKPIKITPETAFMVWGVITYAIKKLHR